MKKLIFVFLIFQLQLIAAAQTPDVDHTFKLTQIFKFDDTEKLIEFLDTNDINMCAKYSTTKYSLLSFAIKTNATDCFEYLLQEGVDLNLICSRKTPLMYAIKYDRRAMFERLISLNADPNIQTSSGKTAKSYCQKYDRPQMLAVLNKME